MGKEAALPKNVRQIGDIQGNKRIYVEDYVMTYIHRKEQQEEKGFLGVFLGERQETEDGVLVFIRGIVEVEQGREIKPAVQMDDTQKEKREESKENTDTEKAETEDWEESEDEFGEEDGKKEPEENKKENRTILEECTEYFGASEIQGCCVIGEYPVKRMEQLSLEIPQSRQLLYHLQEQEETLYWTEVGKYEPISGYFVFYEQNRPMQEYMAEIFGEKESEQNKVPDQAIKNFREKIRQKDQIKNTGILKLASSFFVVTVLLIGAIVVNRFEAVRDAGIVVESPENEAQNDLARTMENTRTGRTVITSDAGTIQETVQESENVSSVTEKNQLTASTANTQDTVTTPAADTVSIIQNGVAQTSAGTNMEAEIADNAEKAAAQSGIIPTAAENITDNKEEEQSEDDEPEAAEAAVRQLQSAYVIREGDTLADICQTYYGSLDKLSDICVANEIEDANLIIPGQKIVLP